MFIHSRRTNFEVPFHMQWAMKSLLEKEKKVCGKFMIYVMNKLVRESYDDISTAS